MVVRVGEMELPVEVEDAFAVSSWGVSACSSASKRGVCFVAAAGSGFVFDLGNGELRRTVALPRAEKVCVAMWEKFVAVGTEKGLVRVYGEEGRDTWDVRLGEEEEVEWLCGVGRECLMVFGPRGEVGRVIISDDGLRFESLLRGGRSSGTVGRIYSTLFTSSKNDDRAGPIVCAFDGGDKCVVAVRGGGLIERWMADATGRRARNPLVWEWNIASSAWEIIGAQTESKSIYYEVVGADNADDGLLCCLIAFSVDGSPARLYVVTSDVGPRVGSPVVETIIEVGTWGNSGELRGVLTSVDLIVSANVAYVIFGDEARAAFVSISPGVQPTDQIYGEVSFHVARGGKVLQALDAGGSDDEGGAVAILMSEGVAIASAGMPAPSLAGAQAKMLGASSSSAWKRGTRQKETPTGLQGSRRGGKENASVESSMGSDAVRIAAGMVRERSESVSKSERAFEVENEDSTEAAAIVWRAHLQFAAEQIGAARVTLSPIAAAFDAKGGALSKIVSHAVISASNRIVDSGSGGDEVAPSSLLVNHALSEKQARHAPLLRMLGDTRVLRVRLWDIMDVSARSTLVGNAGKLMAAMAVRTVENAHAGDPDMTGPSMVITEALQRAVPGVDLYAKISRFDCFLPSLREVFEHVAGSTMEGLEEEGADMTSVGEVALIALGGALATLGAGLEVRTEILEKAGFELDDKGGWSSSDDSISTANYLLNWALKTASGCPSVLREAMNTSTADLADVLIACIREREGLQSTNFASQRSAVLQQLESCGIEPTLALAEKYADFDIMLELTHKRENFESLFETWSDRFGDNFVQFAFSWFERHGEMKSLLRSRAGALAEAQSAYFANTGRTNLRWVQMLGADDFNGAAKVGLDQASQVIAKAGEHSLKNAKTLLSMSRLALLSVGEEGAEKDTVATEVSRRLYLVRAQEDLNGSSDVIVPPDELARSYVDGDYSDSKGLAMAVVIALEVRKIIPLDQKNRSPQFLFFLYIPGSNLRVLNLSLPCELRIRISSGTLCRSFGERSYRMRSSYGTMSGESVFYRKLPLGRRSWSSPNAVHSATIVSPTKFTAPHSSPPQLTSRLAQTKPSPCLTAVFSPPSRSETKTSYTDCSELPSILPLPLLNLNPRTTSP